MNIRPEQFKNQQPNHPYKKSGLIIILAISIAWNANTQVPAKTMYFELGGPGLASFNYDMRFAYREDGIGGRIGLGGFSSNGEGTLFVPVGLNYLFRIEQNNYFELGTIVTPVFENVQSNGNFSSTFVSLNLGYRVQPKEKGLLFRASLYPVFGNGFFSVHTVGLAIGYKF
jgi:hypothetical protein